MKVPAQAIMRLAPMRAVAIGVSLLLIFGWLFTAGGGFGNTRGAYAASQPGTWTNVTPGAVSLNPNSPTNNYGAVAVAVDPQTPSTVYLGTCYQGLWKSTDSGNTWVKIDTGSGSNLVDSGRLWTLAVDPVNPQILYTTAGYGVGGILKSTDGGVSWTDVFSSTPQAQQIGTSDIYSIAIDPSNHTHLLAAFHYYWYGNQSSGLIESTDGGSTWVLHAPAGAWGAGNAAWFVTSQIWLVGSQSDGLWRTTNGGSTWTQVSTSNISHGGINAFYRDPATGTLYVNLWTQFIRSTDQGASWQDITSGLPYAGYESLIGDGTQLFTAPSFGSGDNSQAHGPWYTFTEAGGSSWQSYSSQWPCAANGYCNGPVMMAYDSVHHIVYGADWDAGLFKLQESGSVTTSGETGVIFRSRGTGSRLTRILTLPATWSIHWSFQIVNSRRHAGISIAVYSAVGTPAVVSRIRYPLRSGHGSHSFRGSGRYYLLIMCTGAWHITVRH